MLDQVHNRAIIQVIIALLALMYGYRVLGNLFILLMAPFIIVMIVRQDARFLPALMLHCASNTSIYFLVFFCMMIVCLIKSSIILKNKSLRFLYWCLVLSLPFYLYLTWQKMNLDGFTWQGALGYSCFYLSFWAPLFCYLISETFDGITRDLTIASLLFLFFVGLFVSHSWDGRLASMALYFGVLYGTYLLLVEKRFIGLFVSLLFFIGFVLWMSTFTELLIVSYSVVVLIVWKTGRYHLSKLFIGWIPYIVILILLILGIKNVDTVQLGVYSDSLDFSSWEAFWNRASFKFYGDRAIFWSAAVDQLVQYLPVLPLHDIPNITAYTIKGDVLDEVVFGAHNSPLELLRLFGFLIGGILIVCYMKITTLASGCLNSKGIERRDIPLFILSVCCSIVLFLTGTAAMHPNFALFSFGLCGIAFGKLSKPMGI